MTGDVVKFPGREPEWLSKIPGVKRGTMTVSGHHTRPDRIDLAEDEFVLHVTDPAVPAWKVGDVGETRYEGRTVPTVITQVWADGWFKLRRVADPENPG